MLPRPRWEAIPDDVEKTIAPAAIERALTIYQQLQPRDQSVVAQAGKILTQHILEWSTAASGMNYG
jgi:hypothetical protein